MLAARWIIAVALLAVLSALARAAERPAVSFAQEVAPILAAKCLKCHDEQRRKGGYRLDTAGAMMRAGDSEQKPVIPGDARASHLYRLLVTENEDDRMPQKAEPLPAREIALIEKWIEQGGQFEGIKSNLPLHTLIASSHPETPKAYPRALPVRAAVFTPDGEEIAVGGYHEVTFWSSRDGSLRRRIANLARDVHGIAFQPGRESAGASMAIVSGTPGRIGQLNLVAPDGKSRVLATASDALLAVCFSPDGERVAAGGADNAVRIYNARSGELELSIEQHADWVLAIAFSPDGSLIATGSRDKSARVFKSRTGDLESTYTGHSDAVFGIGFTGDGTRLCSAGRDRELHLWEWQEAKKMNETRGEREVLRLITVGDVVITCSADRAVRRHLAGKKLELIRAFEGHKDLPYAIDYDADRGRLVSGSHDGEVRVWDAETGATVLSFIAAPGL